MGKCECGRLKGNPCGPLWPNTINVTMPLSPIHHANRRANVHRYKVEPYAVAADVYSEPPHVGRGGMVVVHRGCRLALPCGPGVDFRIPKARVRPLHRSLHSSGMERLRDDLPSWGHPLPDQRREPERSLPGGIPDQPRRKPAPGKSARTLVRRRSRAPGSGRAWLAAPIVVSGTYAC